MKYNTNVLKGLLFASFIGSACQNAELLHGSKLKDEKNGKKDEDTHIVIRMNSSKLDNLEKYLFKDNGDSNDQFVPNEVTSGGLITGIEYAIQSKDKGTFVNPLYMQIGGGPPQPCTSTALTNGPSTWYLRFVSGLDVMRISSKFYKERSWRSSLVRGTCSDMFFNTYAIVANSGLDNGALGWKISSNQGGFYYIENVSHSSLNIMNSISVDGNSNSYLACSNLRDDRALWRFIPLNYGINSTILSFEYDPMIKDLDKYTKAVSLTVWTGSNTAPDGPDDVETVKIDESTENYLFWSFTESTERESFGKFEYGVSANFEGIFTGNFKETKTWSSKDTKVWETRKEDINKTTVKCDYTAYVPPRKKVTVKVVWGKLDLDIPFKAKMYMNGYANRLKQDDGFQWAQVDAPAVKTFLAAQGCNINKIIGVDGQSTIVEISGTMKVQGAIKGDVVKYIEDLPSNEICNEKDPVSIDRLD